MAELYMSQCVITLTIQRMRALLRIMVEPPHLTSPCYTTHAMNSRYNCYVTNMIVSRPKMLIGDNRERFAASEVCEICEGGLV
jgi:hypothetical protein